MKYDEKMYYPEEIDGFHIRGMDKRYKYSTMESLEEFTRICDLYEIPYYAMYGTLLGAVRHKGFIPWDDDIDVIMMRNDYNKFIRIASKELRKPFILRNVEDSCFHPLRVQNGTTIRIDDEFINRFHGCPYPTGIDIYVLDNIPVDKEEREIMKTLFSMVAWASQYSSNLYERYTGERTEENDNDYQAVISSLEEFFNIQIKRDGTESKQLGKIAYRVAAMYLEDDTEYIARVESWYIDGYRGMFRKELFRDVIMLPFEYMTIPVPTGYDDILTHLYGDYMTPIKGGGAHQYGQYRTMEKQLLKWLRENNTSIPSFLID